jgi:hypothetical protein
MRLPMAIAMLCLAIATAGNATAMRDPMRPPGYGTGTAPGAPRGHHLHLQSIQFSARQRMAIVNGRPVRRGDAIAGWRVTEITRSTVQLAADGQRRTLTLFPYARKRASASHPRAGD